MAIEKSHLVTHLQKQKKDCWKYIRKIGVFHWNQVPTTIQKNKLQSVSINILPTPGCHNINLFLWKTEIKLFNFGIAIKPKTYSSVTSAYTVPYQKSTILVEAKTFKNGKKRASDWSRFLESQLYESQIRRIKLNLAVRCYLLKSFNWIDWRIQEFKTLS